jgi:hypothetical protein
MELRDLPPGNFFNNLLLEHAGMSSKEFAVISALVVSLYLPLLLAVLFMTYSFPPSAAVAAGSGLLGTECPRPSAFRYARDDAIRHAHRKIADGVECRTELQGP